MPEGVGWTQVQGGPKLEFQAGDVLWCPADQKHWHGATPHEAMTHIAIQEAVNGSPVTWMEKVTDEEYLVPLGEERPRAAYDRQALAGKERGAEARAVRRHRPRRHRHPRLRRQRRVDRFREMPAVEWPVRVYSPDIQDRWTELTKQPGYGPGSKRQAEPAIVEN